MTHENRASLVIAAIFRQCFLHEPQLKIVAGPLVPACRRPVLA